MPVIPEKWVLSNDLQAVFGSQFWGQQVESSRSPDGLATTVQFEPPPLAACSPSGLSRPQFLIAAQASGLPVLPAVQSTHGGWVLDRVLATVGAQDWWACIVGRCKVQRLLQRTGNSSVSEAFWDLDNWGLQAVSKANLRRGLTAKLEIHLESLGTSQHPAGRSRLPPVCATGNLKQKLGAHEVVGHVGVNEPLVDAAEYMVTPLQVSVDVQSAGGVKSNVMYRLGLCQTSQAADTLESSGAATQPSSRAGSSSSAMVPPASRTRRFNSTLQAQGGAAVQGERYLWRGNQHSSTTEREQLDDKFTQVDDVDARNAGPTSTTGQEAAYPADVITPKDIQQGLTAATEACKQFKADSTRAIEWVRGGHLRDHLDALGRSGSQGPQGPWSLFLEPPHVKAGGLLGCIANVSHQQGHGLGLSSPWSATARALASGAMSAQLGQLQSNFLDFTRVSAQLDVGMAAVPLSGHTAGDVSASTGSWHSLSFSASQQLFGPIRLNLDTRFALDPPCLPSDCSSVQEPIMQQVARHVTSLRPHQLDAVWSVDSIVPGSQGLARVVAWYSPVRKEGMLEVRML